VRRLTTALVVAGVALVGVLAVADALRGEGSAERPQPTVRTQGAPSAPSVAETLRREDVRGALLYSDENCILHAFLLPAMTDDVVTSDDDGAPMRRCEFNFGGGRILGPQELASPNGSLLASCSGGRVVVEHLESGQELRSYRGCPPAWRPDGRVTYPQGDRIMEGGSVLVSAQELRDAVSTNPNVGNLGSGVRVFVHATDLVWVGERLLVASLEVQARYVEPQFVTVAFLDGKLVESSRFGQGTAEWVASPTGLFAAAADGSIVTRDADFIEPPDNLPSGRARAFSSDEQWLAYVSERSVYLIATPKHVEPGRVIRIPLTVRDITWEPLAALPDADTATR
jgi:hypothetical protein